ncbi:MAG: hypothetical protein M3Q09_05915 [Gemmatimonadota bacterium]|nr:hypothetical protein [Gemmatimonadota bacterium]
MNVSSRTRSHELWKIFGGPAAVIKRGDWMDRPSFGIPYGYAVTGMLTPRD